MTPTLDKLEAQIRAMTKRELSDLIEGRTRLGKTQAEQIHAWNVAIDVEWERAQ